MRRALLFAVALLALCTAPGPVAADAAQDEQDEIQALELYVDMFSTVEDIDYLMASARDNARPSDHATDAVDIGESARFLRQAHKAAVALAKTMDQLPPAWVERYEKAAKLPGGIRKAAGAIGAIATLIKATRESDSATAADKLRDMADFIKDIEALVGSNVAVGAYVKTMTMAIEDIAGNAAIIEQATRDKNLVIEDVRENLGTTDYKHLNPVASPFQDAIEAAEARLATLRRRQEKRLNAEAYAKVVAAEKACLEQHDLDTAAVSQLRQARAAGRRAQDRIRRDFGTIAAQIRNARLLIRAAEEHLVELKSIERGPDAAKAAGAMPRIEATRRALERSRARHAALRAAAPAARARLRAAHTETARRTKTADSRLQEFDNCVARLLAREDALTRAYAREYFPHYTHASAGEGLACLERPDWARQGFSHTWSESYRGRLAKGEVKEFFFRVHPDTEIRLALVGKNIRRHMHEEVEEAGGTKWRWADENNGVRRTNRRGKVVRHRIRLEGRRRGGTDYSLRVWTEDRGDLGTRIDAGTTPRTMLDLPLDEELGGHLFGTDRDDWFRIANVPAHARIRVHLLAVDNGTPGGGKRHKVSLVLRHVSCSAGERKMVDGGARATSARPWTKGGAFVDYITDRPGHIYLRVRRHYGSWGHRYRLLAERLEPIAVRKNERVVGYLGEDAAGWYVKRLGAAQIRRERGDQAWARRELLQGQ